MPPPLPKSPRIISRPDAALQLADVAASHRVPPVPHEKYECLSTTVAPPETVLPTRIQGLPSPIPYPQESMVAAAALPETALPTADGFGDEDEEEAEQCRIWGLQSKLGRIPKLIPIKGVVVSNSHAICIEHTDGAGHSQQKMLNLFGSNCLK